MVLSEDETRCDVPYTHSRPAPLLSSPLLSSKSQVGCPRNGSGGRLFPFPTIARIAAAVANNVRHTSYRKLDIYSTYFGQREHSALIGTRFGTFESVHEGHDIGGLSNKAVSQTILGCGIA